MTHGSRWFRDALTLRHNVSKTMEEEGSQSIQDGLGQRALQISMLTWGRVLAHNILWIGGLIRTAIMSPGTFAGLQNPSKIGTVENSVLLKINPWNRSRKKL